MSDTSHLKITGMSCKHCEANAAKALKAVAGVAGVDINLEQGTATITGSADDDALISAVKEAGYEAEIA